MIRGRVEKVSEFLLILSDRLPAKISQGAHEFFKVEVVKKTINPGAKSSPRTMRMELV